MFEIKRFSRTLNYNQNVKSQGWYLFDSTAQTETKINSAKFEPTSNHALTFLLPWGLADKDHRETSVSSGIVLGKINALTDTTPVLYDAEQTMSGAFPAFTNGRTLTTFKTVKSSIKGWLLLSVTGTLKLPDNTLITDVHLQLSADLLMKLYELYNIDVDFDKPFWLGDATGLNSLSYVSETEKVRHNMKLVTRATYSYLPLVSNTKITEK